jgi:hypothetical protein
VNPSRTIARLLRLYPAPWRARYGGELEALILDMSDGRRVPWRVRVDVVSAGGRERLRAAGHTNDGPASDRVRAGAVLVMWAWALFILGGAVLAKSTEHWQSAIPAGAGHAAATVAFTALRAGAVVTALLVLIGIGLSVPSVLSFLRRGGWGHVRRRILTAGWLTAALIAATVGLAGWAHGLTGHARDGHDPLYGVAFVFWAALCATTLLAWTAAAAGTARHLHLPARTLRLHAGLAFSATTAMGVTLAAAIVWWVAVASASPAALTGAPKLAHSSALLPQMVLATAIMLAATGLGAVGGKRAAHALPAVREG